MRTRIYQYEKSAKFHSIQIQLIYNGSTNATVDIGLEQSDKTAKERLTRFRKGKEIIYSVPDNYSVGDEVVVRRRANGSFDIIFRKGRVVVIAFSETEEIAKRLANLVGERIPPK